jgi:hypothetical protein
MRKLTDNETYSYQYEGQSGKSILKLLHAAMDEHYKETKHGVALLKQVDLHHSAACSPSVQEFIAGWTLPCWWLNKPH